jgi:hypothetical protein
MFGGTVTNVVLLLRTDHCGERLRERIVYLRMWSVRLHYSLCFADAAGGRQSRDAVTLSIKKMRQKRKPQHLLAGLCKKFPAKEMARSKQTPAFSGILISTKQT